ncbi:hypothetical protein D9615_006832 [Tricholomella constricta]|uniref:Uncharacterized protein n=1 Tax=Tricholomella constricta TaxID=117010 RepID=A0A8H5H6Y4_9AGAR|nr:hypothetical protein D9615_006832 [Tricholomella constricta]
MPHDYGHDTFRLRPRLNRSEGEGEEARDIFPLPLLPSSIFILRLLPVPPRGQAGKAGQGRSEKTKTTATGRPHDSTIAGRTKKVDWVQTDPRPTTHEQSRGNTTASGRAMPKHSAKRETRTRSTDPSSISHPDTTRTTHAYPDPEPEPNPVPAQIQIPRPRATPTPTPTTQRRCDNEREKETPKNTHPPTTPPPSPLQSEGSPRCRSD